MDTSLVHVWLIVNPTSGRGRGTALQQRIERILRETISTAIIRVRSASELLHHTTAGKSQQKEGKNYRSLNENGDMSTAMGGVGVGLYVDIISTETDIRGREIAEHIARNVTKARLQRCAGSVEGTTGIVSGTTAIVTNETLLDEEGGVLHIFAAMGGDGSLSDVVNGMCFGTLSAFRELFPTLLQHNVKEDGGEEEGKYDCCSKRYYWQVLEDKSILRHFLPYLMYICAGTGADFARLKIGCCNEKEFASVLLGICEGVNSLSPLKPASGVDVGTANVNINIGKDKNGRDPHDVSPYFYHKKNKNESELSKFRVFDVDVGRVTFPRSGRNHFFINECSCGMSCDVVERTNKYKHNRILSMTGGTVMFALASIASLVQMRPKPFRLIPLPPAVDIPSNSQIPHSVGAALLHPHTTKASKAFQGVLEDLAWLHENEGNATLPETEPLHYGANYYHYTVKDGNDAQSNGESNSTVEETVNPFYLNSTSSDAKTPGEILAALTASNARGGWICFPSSTLVFGNGRWFGGGLKVTPHADPTDGFLSVTNWVTTFFRFISRIPSLYTGRHTNWKSTTTWNTSRSIVDVDMRSLNGSSDRNTHVTSEESHRGTLMTCLETDGELREQLPCIVEVCGIIPMLAPNRSG